MDTVFKRAFDALEKPFRQQQNVANIVYYLFCVLSIISFGFATGFSYGIHIFQLSVLCLFLYLFRRRFKFIWGKTPKAALAQHKRILKRNARAQFLLDTVHYFAEKMDLKKPFLLAYFTEDKKSSLGVTQSKAHNILFLSPQILNLPNNQICAVVAHELSHIYNKDFQAHKTFLIWHRMSLVLMLTHVCLLDFRDVVALSALFICFVVSVWFVIAGMINLYISRRCEHLADIGAVRFSGYGQALIDALKMHADELMASRHFERYQKLCDLKLITHPTFERRVEVIQKAQCIYDKYN